MRRIRNNHLLTRFLLAVVAIVILLPVVLTALYSFLPRGDQGLYGHARQL